MMKFFRNNKYLYATLFVVTLVLSSCGEFLDIKPYGKTIPETTEDYNALVSDMLLGIESANEGAVRSDMLFLGNDPVGNIEQYCDNMEVSLTELPFGRNLRYYIGTFLGTISASTYYREYYRVISRCNIILDNYKDGRDTDEGRQMVGTCYVLRGLAYYQLLRMYCEPAGVGSQLGVPIVTDFDMEGKPNRSSYEDTFKQAESDLLESLNYTIDEKVNLFSMDVRKALLARLYFWVGQFKEAKLYADEVVKSHPLLSGEEYGNMEKATDKLAGNMLLRCDVTPRNTHAPSYLNESLVARPLSYHYVKLFAEKDEDIRYTLYFDKKRRNKKIHFSGIRTAEMYLISMECAYHLGDTGEALTMLNNFRAHRISDYTPYTMETLPVVDETENIKVDCTGAKLTPLMYAILNERRKELYLEGDRFFELKRNGRPEFSVIYNGLKYTTEKFMYTFPLPPSDIQINPAIKQNPGYVEILY
ncbi:RagB/SusD family nutrient uptake outer membrane protein [Prevotella sp. A2931]|uniref:RagB/SusD family nutrient uptake outer membrane protein n=2 Tax=Prevotellaceae TaxID=171552 RepID=A0ABS3M8C9_9BACT|nr:RagB/SusD family nutrient uptake outer membrane protein [Prevotella illustrans]PTL27303.1 RagB/SusD family nutrient uptake outer membrane protein [Prevotella sp. oral taxon 820]